tara:strand:- start:200 stop:568 length:369 start_codon:yes stop_codon:yes gene_type:complete
MKKLLTIVVLGLLLSGNAYAHIENKFVYLICETLNYNTSYEVHLDFKKKTVSSFNMSKKESTEYKIYKTTERWISAKAIDNENKKIMIHRYAGDAHIQEFEDDKWEDISNGRLQCEKIKKKF